MAEQTLEELMSLFRVSAKYGFLLPNPISQLPSYYKRWHELADKASELIKEKGFRAATALLPELSLEHLETYEQLRLAHLILVTLQSAYVWAEGVHAVPKVLPRQIAKPLFEVSERLGVKACVGHQSACQANWRIRDADAPLTSENMQMIAFKQIDDFGLDWFFLQTAQLELDFAPAIPAIINIVRTCASQPLPDQADGLIIGELGVIERCLMEMTRDLEQMGKHLDPTTFFRDIRPFLSGFTDGKFAEFGGLQYEGVNGGETQRLTGGSAAQSPSLHAVDACFGVRHSSAAAAFLDGQRDYMPPEHRRLLGWLLQHGRLRQTVLERRAAPLTSAYNACLRALVHFRSSHIRTVTRFIVVPKTAARRAEPSNFLHDKGTGGTDFMLFLKSVRDTTAAHAIS